MKRAWRPVATFLLALVTTPAHTQVDDPKVNFLQAVGRFSLELDGAYGDEGSRIWSRLEAMEQGLKQWDATIRSYEAGMASEIRGADPALAARMHAALGGVYLDRSRVAEALREFAAATALDPGRADLYTLQGLAHTHQAANDVVAATQAFRKASALDPRDSVRAYMLARHLMKVGDLAGAKKAQQLVREGQMRSMPDSGRSAPTAPFVRLGLVQERTGSEPYFPPALYSEGFALLQRGEYQQAIDRLKEAARRDPLAANPVERTEAMGRAATAFRDGLTAVAIGHLNVATELTPDRAEAHRMLGRVYVADQQFARGIQELKTALRLNPADERTPLALADALVETEQYPEAEQVLKDATTAFPASGRARYALGRLYQRRGLQAEALREFGAAVTFNPLLGLNGIFQAMGAINAARQNFDAAVEAYEHRVDIHPNDAQAHQDLGDTYSRLNRHDEALAEFAVALMLDPKHAEAYAATAQIQLREGHYSDAAETAQHALELDPTHRQARYTLATSLMRLGRTDEGTKELEEFQRLQGEATAARSRELELGGLRREATVSSSSGDHEKAVSLLRKALALAPDEAVSHLNLGLALLNLRQPAEAVERFKSAVALNGPPDLHRHLADAYLALGQVEESRRELAVYEQLKQESLRRAGANR